MNPYYSTLFSVYISIIHQNLIFFHIPHQTNQILLLYQAWTNFHFSQKLYLVYTLHTSTNHSYLLTLSLSTKLKQMKNKSSNIFDYTLKFEPETS